MEKLSFKVADFEGPLDLLLYLISKHKLNIYDIEISLLLEQYMEAIGELRLENMETASEFWRWLPVCLHQDQQHDCP